MSHNPIMSHKFLKSYGGALCIFYGKKFLNMVMDHPLDYDPAETRMAIGF